MAGANGGFLNDEEMRRYQMMQIAGGVPLPEDQGAAQAAYEATDPSAPLMTRAQLQDTIDKYLAARQGAPREKTDNPTWAGIKGAGKGLVNWIPYVRSMVTTPLEEAENPNMLGSLIGKPGDIIQGVGQFGADLAGGVGETVGGALGGAAAGTAAGGPIGGVLGGLAGAGVGAAAGEAMQIAEQKRIAAAREKQKILDKAAWWMPKEVAQARADEAVQTEPWDFGDFAQVGGTGILSAASMGVAGQTLRQAGRRVGTEAIKGASDDVLKRLGRTEMGKALAKQLGFDTAAGAGESLITAANQMDADLTTPEGREQLANYIKSPDFAKSMALEMLVNTFSMGATYRGDIRNVMNVGKDAKSRAKLMEQADDSHVRADEQAVMDEPDRFFEDIIEPMPDAETVDAEVLRPEPPIPPGESVPDGEAVPDPVRRMQEDLNEIERVPEDAATDKDHRPQGPQAPEAVPVQEPDGGAHAGPAVDEVAPEPVPTRVEPAPRPAPKPKPKPKQAPRTEAQADVTLPKDLAGAKPRYSYGPKQFDLKFDNDIDRAAYITSQKSPSKRDADYLKFVMDATGMTADEVRAHGQSVRDSIKAMARDADPGLLSVPSKYAAKATDAATVKPAPEPAEVKPAPVEEGKPRVEPKQVKPEQVEPQADAVAQEPAPSVDEPPNVPPQSVAANTRTAPEPSVSGYVANMDPGKSRYMKRALGKRIKLGSSEKPIREHIEALINDHGAEVVRESDGETGQSRRVIRFGKDKSLTIDEREVGKAGVAYADFLYKAKGREAPVQPEVAAPSPAAVEADVAPAKPAPQPKPEAKPKRVHRTGTKKPQTPEEIFAQLKKTYPKLSDEMLQGMMQPAKNDEPRAPVMEMTQKQRQEVQTGADVESPVDAQPRPKKPAKTAEISVTGPFKNDSTGMDSYWVLHPKGKDTNSMSLSVVGKEGKYAIEHTKYDADGRKSVKVLEKGLSKDVAIESAKKKLDEWNGPAGGGEAPKPMKTAPKPKRAGKAKKPEILLSDKERGSTPITSDAISRARDYANGQESQLKKAKRDGVKFYESTEWKNRGSNQSEKAAIRQRFIDKYVNLKKARLFEEHLKDNEAGLPEDISSEAKKYELELLRQWNKDHYGASDEEITAFFNGEPVDPKRVEQYKNHYAVVAKSAGKPKKPAPKSTAQGSVMANPRLIPIGTAGQKAARVKSLLELSRDMSDIIGTKIGYKKMAGGRKFAGVYHPDTHAIQVKRAGDLPTTFHEGGHHLDNIFGFSKNSAVAKELEYLGDPATPGSHSSWTKSKSLSYKRGEGMAEFTRLYFIDPVAAQKAAPKTWAMFNEALDANPEFGNSMRALQEDVRIYRESSAAAKIDASIKSTEIAPFWKGMSKERAKEAGTNLIRNLFNRYKYAEILDADAEAAQGKPLEPGQKLSRRLDMLPGSGGISTQFLEHGIVDYNLKKVREGSRGLKQILHDVGEDYRDFRSYIVAKRLDELQRRKKITSYSADEIKQAIEYLHTPEREQLRQEILKWQDGLVQYAQDAGLLSAKQADAMRQANADYVPLQRVFEARAGEEPVDVQGGGKGAAGIRSPFKKIKGSMRDIIDPIESMVGNAFSIVQAADKNAAMTALADSLALPGMAKWGDKVSPDMVPTQFTVADIKKQLEAVGADVDNVDLTEAITVFSPSYKVAQGQNIIKVVRNGKAEFYRLHPEIYAMVTDAEGSAAQNLVSKILNPLAQIKRTGVTLAPEYIWRNLVRDGIHARVVSNTGGLGGILMTNVFDMAIMMMTAHPKMQAITKSGWLKKRGDLVRQSFKDYEAGGGGMSFEVNYFDKAAHRKYLKDRLEAEVPAEGRAMLARMTGLDLLKRSAYGLRHLSAMSEQVGRSYEYRRVLKELMAGGMDEGNARLEATWQARNLQDFSRRGSKMKGVATAVPFLGSQVQGLYRTAQAFKNHPVRTTARALTYITAPTLANLAMNWNDEEYWDRPQWQRDLFWLVKVPGGDHIPGFGGFLPIPKPFELGVIFGTVPERVAALIWKEDPDAMDGFMETFADVLMPPVLPPIIETAVEVGANHSFFQQRPIVPPDLEQLPAKYQATSQTSLTARQIGAMTGISPMKIDHMLFGTTAKIGEAGVDWLLDPLLGFATGESGRERKYNPARAFTTTPPGAQSETVNRFYQKRDDLTKKFNGAKLEAKKAGLPVVFEDEKLLSNMNSAARKMAEIRREIKATSDPKKRQELLLQQRDLAAEFISVGGTSVRDKGGRR